MHPFLLNTVSGTTLSNSQVYGYFWTPVSGWWNQPESYNSSGLTFWYPSISEQRGNWGPSKASLAAGIFPSTSAQLINSQGWTGVGADKYTRTYDIDWTIFPWNASTGYINLNFGSTGHIGFTSIIELIRANSWIPDQNKMWLTNRHGRGIALNGGVTVSNAELLFGVTNAVWNPMKTPWLKRKFSFLRKEMENVLTLMGNCGFRMTGFESDDEFYIYSDYRGIGVAGNTVYGDNNFYNNYLYPNNSSTGSTWFASYRGICSVPDVLISRGITSFRSYMLNHGFTTNPISSKFPDGLTLLGNGTTNENNVTINSDLANNLSRSGSRYQSIFSEYGAVVADWVALFWQDYAEDFKRLSGLTSDNNMLASYGYFKNDVGVCGYTQNTTLGQYTGLMQQTSSDIVPYPDTAGTSSSVNQKKQYYYSFNFRTSNTNPGYVQREVAGTIDSIYPYGADVASYTRLPSHLLDRSKSYFGNSYGYGSSFGIYTQYNFMMEQVLGRANEAPIWRVPNNYLNSGLPGQTFLAESSYELIGITASMRYDPNGTGGARFGSIAHNAGNCAPGVISWHLNPVWGITAINLDTLHNPANYIPSYGKDILNGVSCGSVSLELLNTARNSTPSTIWNKNFVDQSGFPIPGNTLPAGSVYNQYWTHWYPMGFLALISDVHWGRQVATSNVYRAAAQISGTLPIVPGSRWNYVQKPMNTWITDQRLYNFGVGVPDLNGSDAYTLYQYIPKGITVGYYLAYFNTKQQVTQLYGEMGPMYYENMRHQFLNKTGRFINWNPLEYSCVISATGGQVLVNNVAMPSIVAGITCFGVCGFIALNNAKKLDKILSECNSNAGGMVNQTIYLAPGNLAENSYIMSGAQKAGGGFIWRITFANPVTYPSLVVRGSVTGITTEYRVAGITDYINNKNNKFGIWWETGSLEVPVVENPPVPEATRRGILNLPSNPQFEYDATTMESSRNPIDPYFVNNNPDVFVASEIPAYGYALQTESWGSQNGLSYTWPMIRWPASILGPSKSDIDAYRFPWAGGGGGPSVPAADDWPGVGTETNYDVDWRTTPWNTSTGYIGFTFGSPGFFSASADGATSWVTKMINVHSWIPNKYRVFYPSRTWRAEGFQTSAGFTIPTDPNIYNNGTESVLALPLEQLRHTPWQKRRFNFIRTELKALYLALAQRGFTMSIFDGNDVVGDFSSGFWDFRGINGNTFFYNGFMYPQYPETGASWYANYRGICSAPDSLISQGITSFRAFLLTKGFTTTPGNWRYVDGLTARANDGVSGNIAAGGSVFQFLQGEYYSALWQWFTWLIRDVRDDFHLYNGLCADNHYGEMYGYYITDAASYNFKQIGWTNPAPYNYLSNPTKTSTDIIQYPNNPLTDYDRAVTNYYSYNDYHDTMPSMFVNISDLPADLASVSNYGPAQIIYESNDPCIIDRNLDIKQNTYLFANSGQTYAKALAGGYNYYVSLIRRYGSNTPEWNTSDAKKWYPAGYLGSSLIGPTSGQSGYVLTFQSCAEILGQTGFFRTSGASAAAAGWQNGVSAANMAKVGFDRAPFYVSWFLNPVWGINLDRINDGSAAAPANFIPVRMNDIYYGMTYGSFTVRKQAGITHYLVQYGALDSCGNPMPGNTIPPQSLVNQYWTHWYPLGFMALMNDVRRGRHVAKNNVAKASFQRQNPTTAPKIPGTRWFGVQKPLVVWKAQQRFNGAHGDGWLESGINYNKIFGHYYYIPEGFTFNYMCTTVEPIRAEGQTYMYGEAGPMYYEDIRHQYLNKFHRVNYWNPWNPSMTTSYSSTPISSNAGLFPVYFKPSLTSPYRAEGITYFGVCGSDMMRLSRKLDKVVGECQNLGSGMVYETISLDTVNMDERSYLASGAQLVNGTYLWRITFAHPATQSPIIVRGSVTGVTTAYEINGITDYINVRNNKFGIWWSSNYYETPIVENPPISEAERLNVLNLPERPAFIYDPMTMERAERLPREPKDLFYTPNVYCNEGSATGVPDEWFGMRRETIATFQGIPQTGNQTGITDPKGRPYGSFEYNPTNPTVSSPWHNAVYELAIDPYKWGMRGFLMYWPYGAIPRYNYAMRYLELLDEDYFSSTTDAAKSPARIKGFTSAARALLEGKMTPSGSGFSAINQPCNVLLYSVGINGFYGYRWGETVGSTYYPGSMAFWDKCYTRTGSTAAANALYYSYLDRFVEDITSISRGVTASMFTVAFDSAAVAANPGTIQLFANLASPYTRGLSYELGEWYVINKLRQNDINVYVEARPLKVFSLADSGVTSGNISLVPGFCGATAISLWKNHLSVEYNLWFTDPAYAAGNPSSYFNRFVPNNEVRSVIRWAQNTGPLGTTWDPYKVPYKIFTQGASWTINYENASTSYLYTPQQSLFNLYTASDVYRKHKNSTDARNRYLGIAYDYITNGQIIEYNAISRGSCGALEVNPSFNASSLTGYYRVNTDNAFEGNRIGYGKENAFNPTSFISNPVSYGTNAGLASTNPGWWTISGMSFWRQNVKQSSFTGFVQMLDNLSRLASPPGGNTAGWTGMLYPYDTYTNGILPLSMREPERTPLVAFAWVWPANWVWSGNYTPVAYSADNINKVAYSGNLNVNRDFNNTTNIWVYQNIKSVNGGITAPDGSTTAFEFGTTAAGGSYAAISQTWYNIKPGTTYTFSYYRKTAPGASGGQIRIRDVSTSPAAYDTSVSLAFTNPGNWERKEYTFGTGLTQTALDFYILSRSNTATETSGVTVYLWGPQLEEGSTATTYKPTSGYRDLIGGCFLPSGFTLVYNQDKWLNYGACNGISYISPFVNLYRVSGWEISNMYGWTQASEIERIKGQLAGLPRGRKALQPTLMNREDWYYIYEDMLTATGAASHVYFGSTFPHPKSSASNIYPSAWPDTGISSGNSFYLQFLNLLSGTGITLDYVIGDNETNYVQNFSVRAADSLGSVTAYIQNPKYQQDWRGVSSYKSFMDFYGATVGANFANLNGPQSGDKVSYVVWNCIGRQNMQKGFNEMFGYPTMQRYPDAIVANYSNWESEGGPTAGPPDGYGHPQFSRGVVGNASSPFLYGEISQIDWRTSVGNVSVNATDTTYLNLASGASPPAGSTLTRNPWTSLILALQELRSVKRANPYGFVVPWIASVRYEGSLGANGLASPSTTYGPVVGFSDAIVGYNPVSGLTHGVAGNSAYYYELVRHTAMHGVKAIGYWNASSFQVYPTPPPGVTSPPVFDREYMAQGYTYYIRDMAHFDTVLRELNAKLGGYSPYTMTTSRISWYSTYLLSGAPAPTGGYNWRVTVKPGLTLLANGVTLSSSGSTVGTWIWTSGPTLTGIGLTFI